MPITSTQYRNFYFGAGIEQYFVSQFYMMGYEAYTTNPDVGYDISVTNQCRMKFKGEPRKNYGVQVKSSILLKKKTSFYILAEDFNTLCADPESYLICAYYIPKCEGDPCSLIEDRDQSYSLERCINESFMANGYEQYHSFSIEEAERVFTFVDFTIKYFWLNAKQMVQLRDNGYIYEVELDNRHYMRMDIAVSEGDEVTEDHITNTKRIEDSIIVVKKGNAPDALDTIVSECRSIYYLVNDNYRSYEKIKEGKALYSDY